MIVKGLLTLFSIIGFAYSFQAQGDTLKIEAPADTIPIEKYYSPVTFFEGTYQEALSEAKRKNKPLFIDFYADWCFPCKQMDKNVFTNPKIYEYINANFISVKINVEFFEGMDVADAFDVKEYPTILIVDKRGREKGRAVGYQSREELMGMLRRN